MKTIFDTYAWIEYFLGSSKGKKVKKIFESNEIITPIIVLVELSCKSVKENWNFKKYLEFIKANSLVLNIEEKTLIDTGKLYVKMRSKIRDFGLVDTIILAMAKLEKARILTGDRHFKNMDNVIFLR